MFKIKPKYLYKLIASSKRLLPVKITINDLSCDHLTPTLPLSNVDTHFIHLSTAAQVYRTLIKYFDAEDLVFVARLDYAAVEKHINWESPNGSETLQMGADGVYAHLRPTELWGKDVIESLYYFKKDTDKTWEEQVKLIWKPEWLID